jgi:hypothetical protein
VGGLEKIDADAQRRLEKDGTEVITSGEPFRPKSFPLINIAQTLPVKRTTA